MWQRFNFFDVYAYLIPGVALVGLFWVPIGIVKGHWPAGDFSSGLLLVVAAYIAGHVFYYPATEALPTESICHYRTHPPANTWLADTARHPSDFLLDVGEKTFPEIFRQNLEEVIRRRFDLHVMVGFDWNGANDEERLALINKREFAFRLCRSALITAQVPTYGEQYQGLYELMRGLAFAFALGFAYHLGWALAISRQIVSPTHALVGMAFGLSGAVLITKLGSKAIKSRLLRARVGIFFLMLAIFFAPFLFQPPGSPIAPSTSNQAVILVGVAIFDAFFFERFFSGYKHFAREFAIAIYRDFYAYAKNQIGSPTSA